MFFLEKKFKKKNWTVGITSHLGGTLMWLFCIRIFNFKATKHYCIMHNLMVLKKKSVKLTLEVMMKKTS